MFAPGSCPESWGWIWTWWINMKLAKSYCRLYLKTHGLPCLAIGMAMFLPMLAGVLLFGGGIREVGLAVLCGLGPAAVIFLWIASRLAPFLRMIKHQEKLFGVTFCDGNAQTLPMCRTQLLADEWFFHVGVAAFYIDYIQNVTWSDKPGQARGGHILQIETVDGKHYRLFIRTRSGREQVRQWWKESQNGK